MKKLLLSIALIFAAAFNSNAQSCTPGSAYPGANWIDTVYGAYPDTIENFPQGAAGVAYSTDLTFKVPSEVTPNLDPSGNFVGSPIQSFTVDNVTGLPAGFNYACNIANCVYAGGALGCANLYGTTAVTGVYPLVIEITATVMVTFPAPVGPQPVTQPTTFEGYKLVIGTAGTIEAIINPITIHPNPANDKITLSGLNEQMKISSVAITNMEGKVMKDVTVTSATMDVNLDGFESGVYFVVVNHAGGKETLKFIKD